MGNTKSGTFWNAILAVVTPPYVVTFFCVYIDYSDGAWRTGIYLLHITMRRTDSKE
jgi:hypothetical protein